MTVSEMADLGVTRLYTRRERRTRVFTGILVLLCAAGAFAAGTAAVAIATGTSPAYPIVRLRPLLSGDGPLLDLKGTGSTRTFQLPATVTLPDVSYVAAALVAVPVFVLAFRLLVAPLFKSLDGNPRHRGLATARAVRRQYGRRAVRRSGRFTMPATTWLDRLLLPTSTFGFAIGRATTPRMKDKLRVNLEQRVRVVARPGWGKTLRLLVPIIRELPGPAVVASVEPEIFMATVEARSRRYAPTRLTFLRYIPRPHRRRYLFPPRLAIQQYLPRWTKPQPVEHPIAVVDCSSPQTRFAAGYPGVRWNPILGCEDFAVATRRAEALVKGVDPEENTASDTASFFETSSSQVLAAWLHAAALTDYLEIDDIVEWLRDNNISTPRSILTDKTRQADQTAVMNMLKHLDPKGERTTSGVERYLTMALTSLASQEGRRVCGSRHDEQFDMAQLVVDEGTLYLLAEPEQMTVARPLLSLFATEMFLAAERVARRQPGRKKRLPRTFVGVLDELRFGVRVANLPYVANALRKFGISYVYAATNGGDEAQLYGQSDAVLLQSVAGTSIYGGIDPSSAKDISDRAGNTPVVTATRGSERHNSESPQMQETLPISDQQRLGDGECVVVGRGIAPFLAYVPGTFENRWLSRRIDREVRHVNERVSDARNADLARAEADRVIAATGLTLAPRH